MAKKTAEEVIKELKKMLDDTAEMIVQVMSNTNYLKQEQDKIKKILAYPHPRQKVLRDIKYVMTINTVSYTHLTLPTSDLV